MNQRKAKITGLGHSPDTVKALELLNKPDNLLQVIDLAVPYKDRVVSLIGITDRDPERNLGDYQNMGYFLLTENHEQQSSSTTV